MSGMKMAKLVHVHADAIAHHGQLTGPAQILRPRADDAAAVPQLFEDLEAQLWGAPHNLAEAEDLVAGTDATEVLHPCLGIELDA